MAASYPSSAKTFTTKTDGAGNTIAAAHMNAVQDEIAAIEAALVTSGLAHDLTPDSTANTRDLGSSSKLWRRVYATNLSARGVDYVWPSADGSPGQILTTDGSAVLSWSDAVTGSRVLARDVEALEVTNTVTETAVASFTLPADTLGSTKQLRLTFIADYLNNDGAARNLTIAIKLGNTTIFTTGAQSITNAATRYGIQGRCVVSAANATNKQVAATRILISPPGSVTGTHVASPGTNGYTALHTTVTEDMTAQSSVVVYVTHGTASGNISFIMRAAVLEILD